MPKTDPSALTIHRPDPEATRKMYVAINVAQGISTENSRISILVSKAAK
jgi:hypothetical protein